MTGTAVPTGWEFRVLGPVEAGFRGRTMELGPRRRLATLAALVVDVGRTVPAGVLVERVWGADAPDKPLAGLHAYVSRLRSGMRVAGPGDDPPLCTEPSGYRLAVEPPAVDAVRFETLLREARELRTSGRPGPARDAVAAGLALWRGEPYAGVRAGFAETEARRLSGLHRAARLLAAELDLERGGGPTLVEDLERLAAEDPLDEPVAVALLLALYRGGRTAEALRRYAAVRASIVEELGVEPGPALRELHERMLRGDPGPVVRAPRTAPEPVTAPMIGRDAELDRVRAAAGAAWASGVPVVVTVAGEAGIGKTRLLDEAASLPATDDVVLARGRCWQHGDTPVLWPWTQVVRAVVEAAGPAARTALDGRAGLLHAVVPGLPGAPPDDRGPAGRPDRVSLFDALTALLGAVAAERPVLVVLEDMHWADPASREMLEYLALHATAGRLAVLASVRVPNEDGTTGAELLAALTGRGERVTLSGLTPDDVRAYVTARTGTEPDAGITSALTERTEGNPFYVGELVRLLDGPVTRLPDEVPDGVREVILRRIGRLGDDDRRVLQTASVLGRTFDPELLETVCGLGADVVDDAVDRAGEAGFLCADPDRPGEYRFAHALVVDSVRDAIGPGRRRRLHARTAAALRDRAVADPVCHAGAMLHHLVRAGGQEHLDEAVELSVAAADAWLGRGNHLSAEAVLQDAAELVARLTGPAAERRELAVLVRLNSTHDMGRAPALSAELPSRRRALELARRLQSERDLTAALAASWLKAVCVSDFAAASVACDELARFAETTGEPAMWALVYEQRGVAAFQQGRYATAVEEYSASVAAAEHVDTRLWNGVLSQPLEGAEPFRAVALTVLGRDEEAAAALAATIELGRSDNPNVSTLALYCAALERVLADRPSEAAGYGRRGADIAARHGLAAIGDHNRLLAAWGRERCAPGTGRDEMRAILHEFDEAPAMLARPMSAGLLADVLLRRCDPAADAEARSRLDRAIDEAESTGTRLFLPQLHRMRACARDRLGDPAGAADDRVRCVRVADDQGVAPGVRDHWTW